MAVSVTRRAWLQSAGALALVGGSEISRAGSAAAKDYIDVPVFRQALLTEIDHWRAVELQTGFIPMSIDRQWRESGAQVSTLTTQARHVFMRARAFDLTRKPVYLESMRRIAECILRQFHDPKYGGFYFSVAPDGTVVDDSKNSYSMAFALFGFSHAFRVTGDARYHDAAFDVLGDLRTRLHDPAGFLWLAKTRDFSQPRGTLSQNPMLHLYEALIALYEATGDRDILRQARTHIESVFGRLFDRRRGVLPGYYGPGWQELLHDPQGFVDIGDQIEWAYWWSRGVEYGFPIEGLSRYGRRQLEVGLKVGYDPRQGGIFPDMDADGRAVPSRKKLWQQCEFLRALMNWATLRGRSDLWPFFTHALATLRDHFQDAEYGGYFRPYCESVTSATSTDLFKNSDDTYHVCGMYSEGLRLVGALDQVGLLGKRI